MDRNRLTKSAMALAAGAMMTLILGQAVQAAERARVRGTVESISGDNLKVKTREGKDVTVMLKSGWAVTGVVKASAADIKPGDFVGIASLPKADGGDGALEVLIFPPAMKGTGEGSYGWDLKPNSSMTNATVANAVKGVDGHTVTVSYHGKEKKIAIPAGTPVVTLAPAAMKDLVAGAIVFVPAVKGDKGALVAQQIVVGANGVVPPM
jgi:ribosome maturation factor RimP